MPKTCLHLKETRPAAIASGLALAILVVATGCQRQEISVYRAPKDGVEAPPRAQQSAAIPSNWRETPGNRMSVVNYAITGAPGQEATVSVTPLPGLGGRDVEIVNMWREQVGQAALTPAEATALLKPVDVGGQPGKLFEISGKPEGGREVRIVTAMVHMPEVSWFYKLQGDSELVTSQRGAFITFLKTASFKERPATAPRVARPEPGEPVGEPANFAWKVPDHWQKSAAGQMQIAKYAVVKDASRAEASVSVFPSDTGGTLANVNRWRRQMELPEIAQEQLAKLVAPLDPKISDAILVDMTNERRQLLGAIVPRDGKYWFYKLMGDASVVGGEKQAFIEFARSTP